MTGAEIRTAFLEFFRARGHEVVRSSSLIPERDPTLLFTNAGMVQFKNVFLGLESRANPRAASAQKCLRLSGKHNDLDEVGRDTYHHTLFEMLGNWSFGDYYKEEAISWAWELLTAEWKLPKERLYATVFRSDEEAEGLWRKVTDIAPQHVRRFDEKDNFWEMGESGPCGPCSEIHLDRGPETCDRQHVKGHKCDVNGGCARFIELWNLVFIQYNRTDKGELEELRAKHVDTGMGFERVAAVLQNVLSNYDTDLFQAIIKRIEEVASMGTGPRYGASPDTDVSYRAIADHARAISFLIAEGLRPGNGDREYVLRRLIRRAAGHARRLGVGMIDRLLVSACEGAVRVLGDAYQELREQEDAIYQVVRDEEGRFHTTLVMGEPFLQDAIHRVRNEEYKRRAPAADPLRDTGEDVSSGLVLPGDVAFKLYDTYGFPLDMTEDILREQGMQVDRAGFDSCMDEQRRRAREDRKATAETVVARAGGTSRFLGADVHEAVSEITALYRDGAEVQEARESDEVSLVTAETPFYGESGGQVGDRGTVEGDDGSLIEVLEAQKPLADLTVLLGTVKRGSFRRGQRVRLIIDREWRDAARLNHSATHILHAVLRQRLGTHVRQAGSLVAPDRLRFDFTHPNAIDDRALADIEEQANTYIRENALVTTEELPYDEAIARGALAFFGDKYGDRVRVVKMGSFSTELCGGTHVQRTGDIGVFKLRGEAGIAAGVRRVEALTGPGALAFIRQKELTLRQLGELVKGSESEVAEKVERLLGQQRDLERQLQQLRAQIAGSQSGNLLSHAFTAKDGFKVVVASVDGADQKRLLEMSDVLRQELGSGVVILAGRDDGKVSLLAAVTKDLAGKVHAGKLIGQIAPIVGGRGGGRPELAQAGGKDVAKIDEALAAARALFS